MVSSVISISSFEPLSFFYPSAFWDVHRGMYILIEYVVGDIYRHHIPHNYPIPCYVDEYSTYESHKSSQRKKGPEFQSDTRTVIFIGKSFFLSKPFVMFFVPLSKPNNLSELSMHHRSVYIPLHKRIEKDAEWNSDKRDDDVLENSHRIMIII